MRRNLKRIALLLLILGVSVGLVNTPVLANSNGNSEHHAKIYDGETLFRGLIFGQGPVAKLFPNVWPAEIREKANNPKAKKAVDLIIDQIKSDNPTFFDEYAAVMQSGNYVKISNEMKKTGKVISATLKKLQAEIKNPNDADPSSLVIVLAGAVYMYALVVHTAGAAINVAGAVDVYLWGGVKTKTKVVKSTDPTTSVSQLKQEMYINDIVKKLTVN